MSNLLDLNINELLNEYNRMESEINEIDNLYNNSKNLLESCSRGTRSNYVFVANQTSNLISIKNHKLNLLKTMNDIKRSIIDLKIKEYNLNSKNNEINDNTKEIIDQLFKKMMNMDTKDLINASVEEHLNNSKEELSEDEIDKLLEERINDDKNIEINNKEEEKNSSKFRIVIEDTENIPYIIDEDYNLIEEDSSEEFKEIQKASELIVIVKKDIDENGEKIAIDSEGNSYEIVSMEE